jgi:hypothetical protein
VSSRAVLRVRPTTLREARRFVDAVHAHLDRPQGGIVSVGVEADGVLVCVAILGRANARLIGNASAGEWVAEVTRVASDGTTPHAASKALAAITRAALDLGWTRLVSYTLLGEAGTIYRACGWRPTALSHGGEHDRPSRRRRPAQQPGPKVRWETGPAALPLDPEVDRVVREMVGRVPIPPRRSQLPLFNLGARP